MKKTSKIFFYEQLQAELSEIPRHDVITLIGDLNAKVGDENIGAERTMGIHGCGSINNNGERLVELCASNDLVIGGTLFEHPAIHKLTWYSPNGRDKNQIDHIAINNTWRRSLLDVRVKRGADVGSDHLLVIASIRLKLRRTDRRDMHQKRLDVNKLKDPDVRKLFTIQLKNRFQALSEQENNSPQEMENINHLWNQVKTLYQDAGIYHYQVDIVCLIFDE
ncbi:craniofacial development protein 2-like [Elysia marginata]|uniref:Craniofacial development protein 2-like n=1 Tax=Elysia marginata TaxID=1093978 RepID=A0AAV4EXB2_9GAST|nr:craniofacial development protein 2-like [Elysia marginata]